jgi:putative FmdB family regulatory protein
MPVYSYKCRKCENEFNGVYLIDDRKIPEENPCPECSAMEVYQKIGTPVIGYSIAPNMRTSDNFNSRLKEIKAKSGSGNTVSDSIRH